MRRPILCYVTDRSSLAAPAGPAREAALIERIQDAAAAGVDWIQVREKDLEGRPFLIWSLPQSLRCAAAQRSC